MGQIKQFLILPMKLRGIIISLQDKGNVFPSLNPPQLSSFRDLPFDL